MADLTPGPKRLRRTRAALLVLSLVVCGVTSATASAANALRVIPFPGTPDASQVSQIIFSALKRSDLTSVTVTGSMSGVHAGRLVTLPHSDGVGFLAREPFTAGEAVRVSALLASGSAGSASGNGGSTRLAWSFRVAVHAASGAARDTSPARASVGPVQSFRSRPRLHPPLVSVSRDTDSRSGKIFLTPNHNQQAGAMILDGRGRLVWYRPSPRPVYNLQRQRYLGRPVLSWWEGYWLLSGRDFIVDRSYRTVAVVRAQEGYQADFHEFQVTPQGTALLDTYSPVRVDLSGVGGSSTGTVLDCIIQEVDIRTGRLLWEWHSLGHVPLSASYTPVPSGSGAFDYFHLNSIQRLPGGNLLISAKGTWSLYEIDRRTGNVRWTIGGKHPSFSMGPGTNFEWQHDPRLKPDGTLTVFDDAGAPQEEPQSSAKLLRVNTARMKVTLIHRYTHSPRLLAGLAGSVQTLPNQNVFVGWGSAPVFSEYTPDGRLVLDGRFPYGVWSYRAYRFQWVGQPVTRPALATAATSDGGTALYASWNGATRVAYWRVLAGSGPDSLRPAGQVARRTGFETMIKRAARRRCWAVQALDARRMVLATSRVQRVPARG